VSPVIFLRGLHFQVRFLEKTVSLGRAETKIVPARPLLAPLSFPFFLSLSFFLFMLKIINNMDDDDDDNFINRDNFIYDEIVCRKQTSVDYHFIKTKEEAK
jgi:hypothetical protein